MTPRRLVVRSQRKWSVARRVRPVVVLEWRFDDGVDCVESPAKYYYDALFD